MVKTPRTRHSKSAKQPLTIDLEAEKVDDDKNSQTEGAGVDAEVMKTESAGSSDDTAARDGAEDHDHAGNDHPGAPSDGTGEVEKTGEEASANAGGERDQADSPRPVKQRPSVMTLVAAGLVGGVLATGGNMLLSATGNLPGSGGVGDAELAALRTEIASLKDDVRSAGDAASAAAREAASAALAETDGKISTVSGEVDALKQGLETLRTAIESGGSGDTAALQLLTGRLDALNAKVAALVESGANAGAGGEELAAIRADIETVRKLASDAARKAAAANETAQGNTAFIDALKLDLDNLAQRLDQQGSNPKIALAIAAAALKSAIDRGLPFMTELETYAAVAPDAPEVGALRELAATGVPTRAAIAAEMDNAAAAMIAAGKPLEEDAGFFERLIASAQSIIKVRPIGMVEGDTPGAIVARMEVAINGNDYAGALAEFETLPDKAKEAGAAFAGKIRARMKADELIDSALASALKPANG